MNNFLDNIYGVLFYPDETFDRLKENPPVSQGFFIVVIISAIGAFLNFSFLDESRSFIFLGLDIFGSIFSGILSWLFPAFFLEIVSSIFKQSGKLKTFLTLFGFSLVPWIFAGPAELLKTAGPAGKLIGVFLGLFIWLWVAVLVFKAIIKSYELSPGRGLILISIPFLGGFLALYLIVNFFSTLIQILKV